LKEWNNLGDLGISRRIILKEILRAYGMRLWTGFIWLRFQTNDALGEHGTQTSGSIKDVDFLD
jgi:hypothetical protein